MIFVTVGGQMPFNRLVKAVDRWADNNREIECFAQIGPGGWRPKYMEWNEFLPPPVYRDKFEKADLVIAHAGIGTVLNALDLGKKLIVMPRRGYLNETRNDHQYATVKRLETRGLLYSVEDEEQLFSRLANSERIMPLQYSSPYASSQLIDTIRSFISMPSSASRSREANENR